MSNPTNTIQLTLSFDLSTVEGTEDYNSVMRILAKRTRDAYEADRDAKGVEEDHKLVDLIRAVFGSDSEPDFGQPVRSVFSAFERSWQDIEPRLMTHPAFQDSDRGQTFAHAVAVEISDNPAPSYIDLDALSVHIAWKTTWDGSLIVDVEPQIPDLPSNEDGKPLSEDTPKPGEDENHSNDDGLPF